MADFTTIWKYVEWELKVPIPPYIKNVLMCSGFDNCYTIATIEKSDLEYFQDEIRNGNFTKFFKDKTSESFSLENILEGSNIGSESEKEFEFCRGHQKLIITIAKLVKENLEKNGINGFGSVGSIKRYAETSKAKPKTSFDEKLSDASCKNSPERYAKGSRVSAGNGEPVNSGEIAIHRKKLIEQAAASLKKNTPAMYKKYVAIIQVAVESNLVTVSKKKGPGYSAKIKCPYCKTNIIVFHILNGANERGTWNSSNFGRHLVKVHSKMPKPKMTMKKAKKNIDDIADTDSDDDITIKPVDGHVTLAVEPANIAKVGVSTTVCKTAFQPIVNYSDTDESDKDGEDYFFIEVPPEVNPLIIESAIDEGTFIVTSNKPLEYIEDISIRYPDSLYQTDSSKEMEEDSWEDFDEDKIDAIGAEVVPILRNGYKNTRTVPKMYTVNTCAFDSLFSIFVCTYFDNQYYREALELFVGQSRFSELIKFFFDKVQSKAPVEEMRDLYDGRNCILNEIFSSSCYENCDNVTKNPQYTFINCKTGIGGLFGQICTQFGENIASAIELKICCTCETTAGKILPFFTIDYNNVDLRNIQKSISPELSQDRLCSTCKSRCGIHKILNDILVLEVEPNIKIEFQKTISIQNLTDTLTITNKYDLSAVVEFDPTIDHFLSHVKRKNDVWKTYDDLKSSETDTDMTKEIYPFLLFYKQRTYHLADYNDFKTTLLSFFHNNKLCKPLIRKILPSERRKARKDSKHSAQTSSKTAIEERNKQLEMGWKY